MENQDFFQETKAYIDKIFDEAYMQLAYDGNPIKFCDYVFEFADNLDDLKNTALFLLWYKVFLQKEQERKVSLLTLFKDYDSSHNHNGQYSTANDKEYRAANYNYDKHLTQREKAIISNILSLNCDGDMESVSQMIKDNGFYHQGNNKNGKYDKLLTPSSVFSVIVSITGKYKKLKALNERIARGDLRDSSYFGTGDFKEALNQLEDFYHEIEWANISYFEKCIHYYQMEISFRYETYFKLAVAMQEKYKEDHHIYSLDEDELLPFSAFYGVSDGENFAYQNHQIIGMEKYIEKYKGDPRQFVENIAKNLRPIYATIYDIVLFALDYFKDKSMFVFEANKSLETFCQNLWGEQQHIIPFKADAIENNDLKSFYYRRLLNRS